MVQVGATTAAYLADCPEFVLEPRGEIEVKGKGALALRSGGCVLGACV